MRFGSIFAAALTLSVCGGAQAQELYAPSVWDLTLGAHVTELPRAQFMAFACGTNGGPPSIGIQDWRAFETCRPDAATGLHEVYFEYDNEFELWAKANHLLTQAALYEFTSIYSIPIIASVLIDDDGFLIALRLVTDPRATPELRELAVTLGGFLTARFTGAEWTCTDLPRLEGEQPFMDRYEKRRCDAISPEGFQLSLETHNYRRPGQNVIDPVTQRQTVGAFWSETRFEMTLIGEVPDSATRLAAIAALPPEGPSARELLVTQALDCAGCDFRDADFKRANLTGANLAGADLTGANLHEAILRDVNLEGAILDEANLNGVDFRGANLAGASLQRVMLYAATLDGVDMTGADLTEAKASHATMARTNLTDAVMLAVDLRSTRLNDARFAGADLRFSWFDEAQMTRADLTGARVSDTRMTNVTLVQAILVGADLYNADLIGANLRGADLTGADFSYARLTLAILSNVVIDGVNWTGTLFPGGFRPQ